ncbi:MAG: 16S rRNA (guanine(527)-N(7))-methyltransferase RsmG, partial [Thermodesulfobacteriota bacterium]
MEAVSYSSELSSEGAHLLSQGASILGVELSQRQVQLFSLFYRELQRWSKAMNLTALKRERDVIIKHFLDSLTPLDLIPGSGPAADVGTGAGFPAIPLKIVQPELDLTLIERSSKKCIFLEHIIRTLKLNKVRVECADVRKLESRQGYQASFHIILSRATYSLAELAQACRPLLAAEGVILAMKGPGLAKELEELQRLDLDLQVQRVHKLNLPFTGDTRQIA